MKIPQKLYSLVMGCFEGNRKLTELWFNTANPVLRGIKPKDYHQSGKFDNLERIIKRHLEELDNEQSTTTDS